MNHARVSELLFGSAKTPVDADVVRYLAEFEVDEDDDHDQAVQDVTEMCAGADAEFASLAPESATARVLAFLAERGGGGGGGGETTTAATAQPRAADPADAAAAAAASALAAALKDLGRVSGSGNGAGRRTDDDGPRRQLLRASVDEAGGDDGGDGASTSAALDALAGLVPPGACADRAEARRFAAHALRDRFHGDAEAAADWLLTLGGEEEEEEEEVGGGAAGAVADWRRLVQAREEAAGREALARERDRQATLDRFAWVPDAAGGGGGKPPPEPAGAAKQGSGGGGGKAGAPPPRVRYIDGVPVTTRGEKYVVVSEKEEWDGGSRGRVKTKGKRGVGFA